MEGFYDLFSYYIQYHKSLRNKLDLKLTFWPLKSSSTSHCLTLSECRPTHLPYNKHGNKTILKITPLLFISFWHKCSIPHYAQPLVPLIFFSAMETAHPPSSVSTLWSWACCTHAPLIGSSALSGVSWMCALLTRIPKPPQYCCDGEDQEKPLWDFDFLFTSDFCLDSEVILFPYFLDHLSRMPCSLC